MRDERQFRKPEPRWPKDFGEPKGEPVDDDAELAALPDESATPPGLELPSPLGEPQPLQPWERDDDFDDGRTSAGLHQRSEEDEVDARDRALGERPFPYP